MTIQAGQIITIGTAKFIIDDIRDGYRVGDIALRYTLRDGFIKLNGATVLREDYPRLVQWIEENNLWTEDDTALGLFGIGDGLTTMRLPDLRNRFLESVDSNGGVVVEAGVPNITGSFTPWSQWGASSDPDNVINATTGAFGQTGDNSYGPNGNYNADNAKYNFDASRCSDIYGNSDTVQPAAVRLIAQIKY